MVSIDTLKAKREEANKIVSEVLEQSKIIEENLQKSNGLIKNIEINSDESKKLNQTLNRIINSTSETILKFRKERDTISRLLTQVNKFYTKKYEPLLNKIEDKNTGLKPILILTDKTQKEILNLKKLSTEQFNEVKKYAFELKKSNKELLSIDNSIRKILTDCTSKKQKIYDLEKSATSLEQQIKKTHDGIVKLYLSGQENSTRISNLLKSSQTDYESIQSVKENSSKLLNDIQAIYEIAAETGLSGEFDRRRAHLKEKLIVWEKKIFYTTIFLFGIIVLMFICQLWLYEWNLTNHTFDVNFYVRFLIASPVVYYLYFCSTQYSITKKLHDRYSFKTTLAMSIKSHIKLLAEYEKFNTEERLNKILEFIIEGFQKIYSEPHFDDDYKVKLKIANMEMNVEKRIIDAISKTIGVNNLDKK